VANILNKRCLDKPISDNCRSQSANHPNRDEKSALAAAIRSKIEDGNIRGAARIICSDEKPAENDDATLEALRERHPPAATDYRCPPNATLFTAVQMSESDITRAIRSFPAGSSGGPDGLRPQHLLDLISCKEAGQALVTAITGLVNLLLDGGCPAEVASVLFGGRLFALQKKSGGIRPIAIGYTWRRLTAKCANSFALSSLGDKLLPFQVGVGTPGGCEAAVHATRRFMDSMTSDDVIVKLDFSNAFNRIRRDVMLMTVATELPELYKFCLLSYGKPTALKFGSRTIWSEEGVQQGDPLGPLLFCLTIQPLLKSMQSPLVAGFMDDVTLGGSQASATTDIISVASKGKEFGLELNAEKCEVISAKVVTLNGPMSNFKHVLPEDAMLLGAPLSTGRAMEAGLTRRYMDLARAVERLKLVSSHDALLLLRSCLGATKLLFTLRSAHCEGHGVLQRYDELQRSALSSVCNVSLTDEQWLQASLPVRKGGLGLRRVSSLASSAFLASAAGTRLLQDQILTRRTEATGDAAFDKCLASRQHQEMPEGHAAGSQRAWDKLAISDEFDSLMSSLTEPSHKARLLAASSPHSGDWLLALPVAACGLHLDNDAVRVAVGLRLGCVLCEPHLCRCGAPVDALGRHAFSCKRSAARILRHNCINDIIWRALKRAGMPSTKEPRGLVRDDGKRPDGLTLMPWNSGRCATWDVTVVDTLGSAYIQQSAISGASAAETAATKKLAKYSSLQNSHLFFPVALETLGPMCNTALEFMVDIGRKISETTNDNRETSFLFQRLSVAVQRFNSVCLTETFPISEAVP